MSPPAHPALATTLPDLLDAAADRWKHEAVVFADERVTFTQLAALAGERASHLGALGVGLSDKVGILMPNCVDYLAVLFGAAKLGAVPVPLNHRFSARELAHVVSDGQLRVVVAADAAGARVDYLELLAKALPAPDRAPALEHVVSLGSRTPDGFLSGEAFAARALDAAVVRMRREAIRSSDLAMIIYTSGTTSSPKGCMLTHEGLTRSAIAIAHERFRMTAEDRFWDPLPFCHLSSLLLLNACLAAGSTFVAMRDFTPAAALGQLQDERCTIGYPCFDTVTAALYDHPDFAATDLSSLRLLVTIGSRERLRAMQEQVPAVTLLSAYGATEYSGALAFGRPEDPVDLRIETCGPPLPGFEVRIVDPGTGADLPDGEPGELLCRGYGVFEGYYRDPELTAGVLGADGWLRSGDLVARGANGYLTYHGRLKDMVKVGGENVAAAEIEDVLLEHSGVRMAQVVAAPDRRYAEVPAAFVELRPGAFATEDELIAHCVERIAKFKVPRYVRFVDEWPMSGTKIQKVRLRERIAAELDAARISEAPRLAGLS